MTTLTIYTDGSYKNGIGGYAVVIEMQCGFVIRYGPVPLLEVSNQKAELYAVLVALRFTEDDLNIYTDSQYTIGCLTVWWDKWMATSSGKGKVNWDLIKTVRGEMEGRNISFHYTPAHSKNLLNDMADTYAKKATLGNLSTEKIKFIPK